jgi:hypothetical protein
MKIFDLLTANFFLRLLPHAYYRNISSDETIKKKRIKHTSRYKKLIFNANTDRIEYPFAVSYHPDSIDINDSVFFSKLHSNFESFTHGNVRNNSGDIHRFYSLIFNLEQLKKDGIPGNFAELGVYKGNTSAILACYAKETERRLFLLDTFVGFHPDDVQQQKHIGIFSDTDIASVKNLVGHDDVCTYISGHFPDSITDDLASSRFCFVSLDCDLYKPTKAGLEFFYPRLEKGGYLFIHDYHNPWWKDECTQAVDEFCAREREHIVLLPDKSGTAVLRK